jgi:hypothetical protein
MAFPAPPHHADGAATSAVHLDRHRHRRPGPIRYFDVNNDDLVAHCSNATCTSATLTVLDNTSSFGQGDSLTIGADGLGLISYYDATNFDLRVAHCANTTCTSATHTTVNSAGDVGIDSITIGTDGRPDRYRRRQRHPVAHCSNTFCTAQVTGER